MSEQHERIAELNGVARLLAAYPGPLTDRAAKLLREMSALLAKASEGEPPHPGRVVTQAQWIAYLERYIDWQRAGRLAALDEIARLKAQLAERQSLKITIKPCGDCWLQIDAPSGNKASINLGQRGVMADGHIVGRVIKEVALYELNAARAKG